GLEYFYELFTKRNLIALSILYNEIEKIKDNKIKDLMKFVFTSALAQVSKLNSIDLREKRRGMSRGWTIHSYWIPVGYREENVWNSFVNRYKKILKGKEQSNKEIKKYKEAKDFKDLRNKNILILTQTAYDLSNIPDNSVDYVFTDPPYGGAIQYLELSAMWGSWLKFDLNFKEEITINRSQKKDFDYYHKMLHSSFREVYRVLKPNKYLTLTFHNTDIKVWNSILKAVIFAGFDLEKIIYQPPPRASAKGLLQPYGSAVGDYYIRFKKSSKTKKTDAMVEINKARYERVVVDTAKEIIADRGEPVPYQYILNGIIPELDKHGVLLKGDKDVEEVMKSYINKELVLVEVKDKNNKIIGSKWWLKDPKSIKINLVPLTERVEKTVINVLNRKIKVSFSEVLQELFMNFQNALTPETQRVKDILEEYANKDKGVWFLKNRVKERESQHNEMIYYLAKIGNRLGYKIWIGLKEQGYTYSQKVLRDLCDFKKLEIEIREKKERLEKVQNIDVIWIKDDQVEYVFEVENTTAITEAVVRVANIPYDRNINKYLVIPEERENLLYKKIKEPALKELNIEEWKFIFYDDLREFFNKKNITIEAFMDLNRKLKNKVNIQNTLKDYKKVLGVRS
ncbi:MAG: DNA methyltransferase, partial [Methanosarcinales archaeon]